MLKKIILIMLLLTGFSINANADKGNSAIDNTASGTNLVLVTIDGLRWQELFSGADPSLLKNEKFVRQGHHVQEKFWHDNEEKRRQLLMPFFWNTFVKEGMVIGNRNIGSNMSIANQWHFSYPGYSEIFTGVVDHSINSNKKKLNPQISFLEWLNTKEDYQHKLAAFGSWDVFPFILNKERSQLYINAGFDSAKGYALSNQAKLLNNLQKEIPSPWHNVRLDSFTYRYAKDYLLTVKPKVMIIALGETDDFAHDGHYDSYLSSAHQTDKFIADLWHTLQTTSGYQDNTVLMITTDHGRGSNADDWQHHASKLAVQGYMKNLKAFPNGIIGSENIWFAAMGPGVRARGEIKTTQEVKQNQIAATALTLLGEDPKAFNPTAGSVIQEVFE
ncbi:sulfatase-like hydrolase/transferase [Colwellia psychrerythraea]|uniref:Type I phosphodiesterase/nucleotide pyrophosphatase n=1 Tax=Colwellia psychrerythraea TaxID=28229 RepID=A0A099KZM3_COLPS|nr:sulfatase-like hydrolase/transferase [Colwellia psychrerythraea]KGJ95322.1 type I phosphodiesterase/nucleotide pyrophosphatase [Colwellia psychrerythraea]